MSRVSFTLRFPPELRRAVLAAAALDLRGENAEVEALLRDALAVRGVPVGGRRDRDWPPAPRRPGPTADDGRGARVQRLDRDVHDAVREVAEADLRSVAREIEALVREALARRGVPIPRPPDGNRGVAATDSGDGHGG